MQATLQKWGNSQGLRIPKSILDLLQWDNNEKVEITTNGTELIIKKEPQHHRKTLEEMFQGYSEAKSNYVVEEIDWGEPVGDEVW